MNESRLAINKKLRVGSENHAGSIFQFGVLWTCVSEGIRLIGHHSNNKKITPFLNSLEKRAIYFENIYVQHSPSGGTSDGDLRALLGQFQFTPGMVKTQMSKLSGGERARVAMLKLLLEENNLLLLDEPTNHLDTDAADAVEEALKEYDGAIISVSHDRWFLDQVCDTIWELKGDGSLKIWPGNYSEYIRRSQQ